MKRYFIGTLILSFFVAFSFPFGLQGNLFASSGRGVGKVVLLKGDVRQIIQKKQTLLKEGDTVEEGGIVKTGAGGAVKIFLQDQTVLSLGPSSTLDLDEVKSKKIPNISLVEGQIRTKVMKNMISSAISANQVKFIVRTKTAAMGVRGTDFQVIYNPANNVTSLVTFEGAVAMVKTDPSEASSATQTANLLPLLTNERAVVVTEGRFSSANPVLPQITLPVKISPAQFESLKRTDPTASSQAGAGGAPSAATKSFVSPVPPGVDPKSFASTSSSLEKQVSSALGITDPAKVQTLVNSAPVGNGAVGGPATVNGFTVATAPPPEGQYNTKTGSYAPPAGGFLDLKSGLYIPPPPGSSFDANTGVYNPPAAMGKFDASSGNYVPPKDFQLDAKLGLVPLPRPAESVATGPQGGNTVRTPASAPGSGPSAGGPSVGAPSIVPGFSALNGGGKDAPAALGTGVLGGAPGAVASAGGMPGMTIPGMVGGALPGMNIPGVNNSGNTYSGYGAPIATALPPAPLAPIIPISQIAGPQFVPIGMGNDPACPLCAPPPPPPNQILPTSTKVGFSFTVQ